MKISPDIPLTKLLDLMLDAICVVDEQDKFVFASAACERVFGYSAEEIIGKTVFDLVHPEDRQRTLQTAREIMSGNAKNHFENRYVRKDGNIVHIMWSAQWSENLKLRIAVARDITERKSAELVRQAVYDIAEAANTAEDFPSLFQLIHRIISGLMTANNFCVALYDAPTEFLSFPYFVDERHPLPLPGKLDSKTRIAEVIRTGKPLLFSAEDPDPLSWLGVPLKSEQNVIGVLVVRSYSGNTCYTETDLDLLHYVSTQVATAIEHKTMLTRLQYMAQYDQLTGLPNRELFVDRLHVALAQAKRDKKLLALLFIDLDKFKSVNDTMGHAAGDLLLQQVAERLSQCVRSADTVARLGGDEFVVLIEGISSEDDASICAEKIYKVFAEPFEIEQQQIEISPSIGVAVCPKHGEDEDQLLKYADQAMYDAKKLGINMIQLNGNPESKS